MSPRAPPRSLVASRRRESVMEATVNLAAVFALFRILATLPLLHRATRFGQSASDAAPRAANGLSRDELAAPHASALGQRPAERLARALSDAARTAHAERHRFDFDIELARAG